jgi:hypothetical protein
VKTEAVPYPEMTVNFYQNASRHIPEDSIIHSPIRDSLSYLMELIQLCFDYYRQVRAEVCRGDGAKSDLYMPKPPIKVYLIVDTQLRAAALKSNHGGVIYKRYSN